MKHFPAAGVALKPQHVERILSTRPSIGCFEVHAENYMGAGGPPHRQLAAIRDSYPLSIHGVGLSLGGADDLDARHLERLRALVRRYQPALVSEHLAWTSHESRCVNDLLPVPYTRAALERVADHVDRTQNALGRQILLENPSTYLAFECDEMTECDFIAELSRRTGCGLLLDVNNVYVASINRGGDASAYLSAFPMHRVQEIHLAGHSARVDGRGRSLLVDSHDAPVANAVWDLFAAVLAQLGRMPTIVERDSHIPSWEALHAEAQHAEALIDTRTRELARAVAC